MRTLHLSVVAALSMSLAAACGDSGDTSSTSSNGGSGGGSTTQPVCTEPTAVLCEDDVVLQMNLKSTPTDTGITNAADGAGFLSVIDASAGGPFSTDPTSYTYGRFTEDGLVKVDISDEDSLTSMDWDIAFRRYVGRINSGHSGPSCVTAARLPGTPDYDALSTEPDNLTFRSDTYFTESCELIPDGSGLEGSPATALSSYWSYPGCVAMTGNVYVLELASGQKLKLTVTSFYKDDVQAQCDTEGTIPMSDTGSGMLKVRWAFLP